MSNWPDELRMYDDAYRRNHRMLADGKEENLDADRFGDIDELLDAHGFDQDSEALVELIMSPKMLRALGFAEHWFFGSEHNANEADDEQAAHLKAQRKPEQHGGMVQMRWERSGEWRAFDEKMAERSAHENARAQAARQELQDAVAAVAAAEAKYAAAVKGK